jgi:hypothetical protein
MSGKHYSDPSYLTNREAVGVRRHKVEPKKGGGHSWRPVAGEQGMFECPRCLVVYTPNTSVVPPRRLKRPTRFVGTTARRYYRTLDLALDGRGARRNEPRCSR